MYYKENKLPLPHTGVLKKEAKEKQESEKENTNTNKRPKLKKKVTFKSIDDDHTWQDEEIKKLEAKISNLEMENK